MSEKGCRDWDSGQLLKDRGHQYTGDTLWVLLRDGVDNEYAKEYSHWSRHVSNLWVVYGVWKEQEWGRWNDF